MVLNLGSGDAFVPEAINIDIAALRPPAGVRFVRADLTRRWPFADNCADRVIARDIVEHLPDKINTMNEAHRVLRAGGVLELFVPIAPYAGAWQDPTHRSTWTPNDLSYYIDGAPERSRFAALYGITARYKLRRYELTRYTQRLGPWSLADVVHMCAELVAVK